MDTLFNVAQPIPPILQILSNSFLPCGTAASAVIFVIFFASSRPCVVALNSCPYLSAPAPLREISSSLISHLSILCPEGFLRVRKGIAPAQSIDYYRAALRVRLPSACRGWNITWSKEFADQNWLRVPNPIHINPTAPIPDRLRLEIFGSPALSNGFRAMEWFLTLSALLQRFATQVEGIVRPLATFR